MKTTIEISNGVEIYKLTPINEDIFLENERGEAMTLPERDLFDLIHEYFEREF